VYTDADAEDLLNKAKKACVAMDNLDKQITSRVAAVERKQKDIGDFLEVIKKNGVRQLPANAPYWTTAVDPDELRAARERAGEFCKALLEGSLVRKALEEGTGSAGGFAVPTDFARDVYAIATGASVMLPIATRINMQTNVVNLVSLTQDWTLVWLAEADSITEGEPVFARPILTAKKVASRFNLSNELLRDNQIDLLQKAADRWLGKFGREIDRVIFMGDTTASPDEPANGILVDSGVSAVTLPSGATGFDSMSPDHLLDLIDAVDPRDAEEGRFYMHPSVLNQIRRTKDL
jgi:HK97 family phage major capsid protein